MRHSLTTLEDTTVYGTLRVSDMWPLSESSLIASRRDEFQRREQRCNEFDSNHDPDAAQRNDHWYATTVYRFVGGKAVRSLKSNFRTVLLESFQKLA